MFTVYYKFSVNQIHFYLNYAQNRKMNNQYGDRLKQAMSAAKVDTKALANACNFSYQAVYKILESGSSAFGAVNNSHAAKLLNVSADWLATGEGPPERSTIPNGHWRMIALELARLWSGQPVDAKDFIAAVDRLALAISIDAQQDQLHALILKSLVSH